MLSKEECRDVDQDPLQVKDPLIPSGTRTLEVFDDGDKTTYYVKGQKVDRKLWLETAYIQIGLEGNREEARAVEKKAFANIKNYLHNTLGITKSHVQSMLQSIMKDILVDIVRHELGLPESRHVLPALGASHSRPFADVVRKIVVEELQKLSKTGSLNTYVDKLCQEEIRRHVLAHMKVDIRVQTVSPQDGVMTEMVTPDYREVRDV